MLFMLLFSRQGKLRLQKWYMAYPDKTKEDYPRTCYHDSGPQAQDVLFSRVEGLQDCLQAVRLTHKYRKSKKKLLKN